MRSALVLFSFLTLTNFSFCQNDTIFPNNGASWYVKSVTYDMGTWYGNYECELLSDTFDSLGYTWSSMVNQNNDTLGWVSVDSGKVYYKGESWVGSGLGHTYDGDTIFVLYDFTKEIGDTVYSYADGPMIIDDIYLSNFLGISKRTFELSSVSPGYSDIWIEGMGSTSGFFRPFFSVFELEFILCSYNGHYIDSLNNYYDLSYDNPFTCEQLSAEENKIQSQPLFGSDWIHFNSSEKNQIQVYSISGALILVQDIPAGSFRADLSFLQSGIYLIRIGTDQSYRFAKY
jgi:hypothetical protein